MKYLLRVEKDRATLYRMTKGPRQMVSIAGRLYRCDDDLFIRDTRCSDAIIAYRIDSTQPLRPYESYLDSDMTRALIDSSAIARTKKSVWARLDKFLDSKMLVLIIVIVCLIVGLPGMIR